MLSNIFFLKKKIESSKSSKSIRNWIVLILYYLKVGKELVFTFVIHACNYVSSKVLYEVYQNVIFFRKISVSVLGSQEDRWMKMNNCIHDIKICANMQDSCHFSWEVYLVCLSYGHWTFVYPDVINDAALISRKCLISRRFILIGIWPSSLYIMTIWR